jgi:outer membrane protein OmpA-like peptidoglycan-associated protein
MIESKSLRFVLGIAAALLAAVPALIAQVDVARQTTAITYPLDEVVFVQFRGTTRFPRMKGEAKVKRTNKNGTEVELSVSKMPRPFELGAGYATYVLWAVSPEGQIDNLGEIKRRGTFEFDSKISVTTPLQTFALIITAEPHFLVRRPSQAIMLENLSPYTLTGVTISTTRAVQYFGNSSDYFRDARTPEIAEIDYQRTPSTILQARQAVALARFAGAQRDAVEELQAAEALLQNAENAWKASRPEESVDITARQAVAAGVKAEQTAVARKEARDKRNEKIRQDAEIREAEDKYLEAQNEITRLKDEIARERRNRELGERDVSNVNEQIRELRDENGKLREEIGRLKVENDGFKTRIADVEAEKQALREQQEKELRLQQMRANQPALVQALKQFGAVRQTDLGIVLTLPESFWTGPRVSAFSAAAVPKLNNLATVLAGNPEYRIVIQSHTDDSGDANSLVTLTEERAKAIADKFASLGTDEARIETRGLGGSVPVVANTTAANRARNRRVDIVLLPFE